MTLFKVRRFTSAGFPEAKLHDVEAETMRAAAEQACGEPLTPEERAPMYRRADVRAVQHLDEHHYFYAVREPIPGRIIRTRR